VTFDGRPVDGGEIIFAAVDKGVAPDAGRIDNGAYDLLVKAGKKRVEIRASRPVLGGMPSCSTFLGQRFQRVDQRAIGRIYTSELYCG